MPSIIVEMDQKDNHVGDEAQRKRRKCSLIDELDTILELKEWSEGAGSCACACKAQASARVDVHSSHVEQFFSCSSQERALNVTVTQAHTRCSWWFSVSFFSLELLVRVFSGSVI